MVEIPVKVCGDQWLDIKGFKEILWSAPLDQHIVLDFRAEGPSMGALGILDELENFCKTTGRSPDSISVIRNPNRVEKFPYRRPDFVESFGVSHFFKMSCEYWTDLHLRDRGRYLFGLFIGRVSIARGAMLYDCWNLYKEHFLFSCMDTHCHPAWEFDIHGIDLEKRSEWIPDDRFPEFRDWWKQCPIESIDGHDVGDQYNKQHNTNRDLLKFYDQFSIEIVAETFTIGETFFPTEKTIRPIVGGKPMLIYGPTRFLERLQELGFKTWGDLWDESYDRCQGFARWKKIQQVIDGLTAMPAHQRDILLDQAQMIAVHNHNHLKEMLPKL